MVVIKIAGRQWLNLFWGAPKSLQMVTAAMKLKKCLLLRRKVMTKLDRILKGRDITLSTKLHLVKAMVFPVVMYECEKNHELPKYERKLSTEGLMLWNCGIGGRDS